MSPWEVFRRYYRLVAEDVKLVSRRRFGAKIRCGLSRSLDSWERTWLAQRVLKGELQAVTVPEVGAGAAVEKLEDIVVLDDALPYGIIEFELPDREGADYVRTRIVEIEMSLERLNVERNRDDVRRRRAQEEAVRQQQEADRRLDEIDALLREMDGNDA